MCFSSKKSSGPAKPAPVAPDPNNAPAANPDMQQRAAATSAAATNTDPLGQAQLGQ